MVTRRREGVAGRRREARLALNWLAGQRASAPDYKHDSMIGEVVARVEGLVRNRQPTLEAPSPGEALRLLLRGRSPHGGRGGAYEDHTLQAGSGGPAGGRS